MRDGFRVADCDIHVIEPSTLWEEYLGPTWRERAPIAQPPDEPGWLRVDGKVLPAHADTQTRIRQNRLRYLRPDFMSRLEERSEADIADLQNGTRPQTMLAAMDTEGVDLAVVFRTKAAHTIAFDDQDPEFSAALCRAFNRWAADFCSTEPSRLRFGAQIPLQDPAIAAHEARVGVEELGAVTLVLPSHPVKSRPLYAPELDVLWRTAEELGTAVSFHGIHASYTQGMLAARYQDNFVLGHVAGQPIELMLSLGEVIAGGVAARHPDLRFAFLEGNCGWLPWFLHALDERWKEYGDTERFGQDELPSELFARQCFVATDVDEKLVTVVADTIGDDNLVLSTDWPHDDSAFPHAIEEFLSLPARDETKRKVLWDNCVRCYDLGL